MHKTAKVTSFPGVYSYFILFYSYVAIYLGLFMLTDRHSAFGENQNAWQSLASLVLSLHWFQTDRRSREQATGVAKGAVVCCCFMLKATHLMQPLVWMVLASRACSCMFDIPSKLPRMVNKTGQSVPGIHVHKLYFCSCSLQQVEQNQRKDLKGAGLEEHLRTSVITT